ncbi:aldolase [Paraliobacillus sediminis]|uniref:aldolase n=1 Tax=Paraliobacillus sediminis TaxID=1885916 RepID=UPI000E3E8591|nr:aldolase [Paraliobacillus sediminis]
MIEKLYYHAFGLDIVSDRVLPELTQVVTPMASYELTIENGKLSELWATLADTSSHFVVKEKAILFHVPDTAIFLIENGNRIVVSPIDETKHDEIRLYLLGTCMGALLMQRKLLTLHGSAIVIDGNAYAIVGDSGAGKSTLASAFLQRGYHLLSDDVIPITFSSEGKPHVIPSYPSQKLWIETLQQYGKDTSHLKPIVFRETKFSVPIESQFAFNRTPLAGVFELIKTDNQVITLRTIEKLDQFYLLYKHTYRNFLYARASLMDWHFQTSIQIASQIPIYQLKRPTGRFTAGELAELILATIEGSKSLHE